MAIHRVKVPDFKNHKGFLNDHALALMTINANSLGYYPMDEVYHICIVHEKIARLSFLSFRRLTR